MEKLFEKIKDTADEMPSFDLRKRIKHQLLVIKFRKYLFIIFPLLIINLFFLGITTYGRMLENESLTVIKVFLQDFDFDLDYTLSFIFSLKEILPLLEITIWTANLCLVIYLSKIMYNSRRELFKI